MTIHELMNRLDYYEFLYGPDIEIVVGKDLTALYHVGVVDERVIVIETDKDKLV